MLKVLHMWKSDSPLGAGGGAGSMQRIHANLKAAGVDSKMLCQYTQSETGDISLIPMANRMERLLKKFTSRLGLNDIHMISSFKVKEHPAYRQADVVNFHGIHSEYLNYLALPGLTAEKPAVFTLRDMWALTGHCACSNDCMKWQTGCGSCPYLDAHPPVRRDATRLEWKLKNWVYSRSKLTIVGISRWLTEMARKSMLNRFEVCHIPNGVDTDAYEPLDREKCRWMLGIPKSKKVLLSCSVNLNRYHKGADLLDKALSLLPASLKSECVLLLLGGNGEQIARHAGIESLPLGYVTNPRLKAVAYSAADLFVHPTRSEALGNVLMESMSCGVPMASFRVGGVPDLVRPDVTGYLAEPEDAAGLSSGIELLLGDTDKRVHMGYNCRAIALEEYPLALERDRYIALYQRLLGKIA